ANRYPTVFAGRHSWSLIRVFKPGNNARCFRSMALLCFVIVRKGAVEWIEPWRETYGNVIAATGRIGVVHTAIILRPLLVPRAYPIRNRIVATRLLADPKHGGHDLPFPWIMLSRFGPISSQLPGRERN